jgi:hypothetical protein
VVSTELSIVRFWPKAAAPNLFFGMTKAPVQAHFLTTLGLEKPSQVTIFDPARRLDREKLDNLTAMEARLAASAARNQVRPIEPCPDILARTVGKRSFTDDNMGSEWLHVLGSE